MKSITKSGIEVRTNIKAGGFGGSNHNRSSLKVRSSLKAGGFGGSNHNRSGLKVRSSLKAGAYICRRNHNARVFSLR